MAEPQDKTPSTDILPLEGQTLQTQHGSATPTPRAYNWQRAAADFELAAHQPDAVFDTWSSLLPARRGAAWIAPRLSCREFIDRFENAPNLAYTLLFFCRVVPCEEADAARLVKIAERLVAGRRDASNLDILGSALYRAGRFEEAERVLRESIKLQGQGGFIDTWLFLAMTLQRLGQNEEARQFYARFEERRRGQTFPAWLDTQRWNTLQHEARRLIQAMPRVVDR